MKKEKEIENEGIGIFAIVIIIFLGLTGVYLLYNQFYKGNPKREAKIPLETPSVINK